MECVQCGSKKVYKVMFSTYHSFPTTMTHCNDGEKDLDIDDLPDVLEGHYCDDCKELVSTTELALYFNYLKGKED